MSENRTEKPTKRRLEKAREEGQFAVSREFMGAAQFMTSVALFHFFGIGLLDHLRKLLRNGLATAFAENLTTGGVIRLYESSLTFVFLPVLLAGSAMSLLGLAAQLGSTRLGFSLNKLTPDLKRLNPLQKIKSLPAQNLFSTSKASVLLPIIALAVYVIARPNLEVYLELPAMSLVNALAVVTGSIMSFLWKAAFAFVLIGVVDFLREQQRHSKSLRMSKQDIKDESKESDGSPETKGRIRRLQRDAARRNMMKEIPKATAVIVNPTHYAVAIRYDMETMGAPRVVAKGKNYLALRIRAIANDHQIPIVENQPLAQALYKSADVGQEIPPDLYRAVAEILAYIFKLMHGRGR